MDSQDLRERFLAFFAKRGHSIVPSDSLIPSGDPTVLFTSAGMNQFKDFFLGKRADLVRAASCQKCLRTGDLERVGKTASHHTFFEMLGNFSFGDYFKREAIQFAWDFLTREIQLPKNRLWVSVFEEDEEAQRIWKADIKVPAHKIVRLGESENFWPANARTQGPNGPCGPCSEIYFERSEGCLRGGADCAPGCICGRFVEVWNLVFTQFDRKQDGMLEPLPRKNIDTGMGLERLACVVQGTETDYETDLFAPIINDISALRKSKKDDAPQALFATRAIADHMRAIVFLIADGVRPSNESRGYVLRMLIRRAARLGRKVLDRQLTKLRPAPGSKGGSDVFLVPLIEGMMAAMAGSPYHEDLRRQTATIQEVVDKEEAQFVETLEIGTERLEELLGRLKEKRQTILPGDEAFKLYDTYGFPLEITIDIAAEYGIEVDQAGFARDMEVQQERSRAGSRFGGSVFIPTTLKLEEPVSIEFVGYQILEAEARVKGIWRQGQWATTAQAGEEVGVILDRSPFYGEAGGQVGDHGVIEAPKGLLDVVDTQWADELLVHHVKVKRGTVAVNEPVRAKVDGERRLKIARSHTATHLLHWALRQVLGPQAVQAGSLVEAERVRFDFSAPRGLDEEQQAEVEQFVNDKVRSADPVQAAMMGLEEAKRLGALALFGEKYGQEVRVVCIGGYSRELCGGTHLAHTGSIGTLQIVAEGSIAAGTRRIEAVVGGAALTYQQQESHLLRQVAQRLNRSPREALQGLEELTEQLKTVERQLKTARFELAQARAKQLLTQAKRINDAALIAAEVDGADREFLATLADAIKAQSATVAAVLVAVERTGTVAWVMGLSADLVARGLHAGEMLKGIAAITQGGGGGRADFAQAGGRDPSKVSVALKRAEGMIWEALSRP